MPASPAFNEYDVLNALRVVRVPYLEMDLAEAGMVENVVIDGRDVRFRVALNIPPHPVRDGLQREILAALERHLPSLGKVDVELARAIPARASEQQRALIPGVGNTIAVASGKGGVGKSTVAVNLAVALARAGARVGLLDADIYGPSIPMMLGINEQPPAYVENERTRLLPIDKFGVKVMSIGFLVDPGDALIWRGPMASGALKQFLSDVEWGGLDYLVFDLPPGTGDIQLTLSQTLPLTGAVIVTTPQDISLADARKGVRMFERVSVPILGIVENMSHFICSHCGAREDIFGSGGGARAAAELGVPLLGEIPLVTSVREGGDLGIPVVERDPDGELGRRFMDTAMRVAGTITRSLLTSAARPDIDIAIGGGDAA
jgi:ATP-binding protein involved in chromosome partitioning